MEYTEDKLTEWFDIRKQKPWEPGVYQVDETEHSYWDGETFKWITCDGEQDDIDRAFRNRHMDGGGAFVSKWRGLSFEPVKPAAPKKKSGNKRKTMYVVHAWLQRGEVRKVVGSYTSLNEALKKKVRYKQAWIEKIRFRTPEA